MAAIEDSPYEMTKQCTEPGAPLDAVNRFLNQRGKPPVVPGVLVPNATPADDGR